MSLGLALNLRPQAQRSSFSLSIIWDYKSVTLFLVEVGGFGHRDTVFILQHINAIIVGLGSS